MTDERDRRIQEILAERDRKIRIVNIAFWVIVAGCVIWAAINVAQVAKR
jgi:hypothetical protein